ncbi:MAG: DUF177 domain-containing protein [Acidobacteria bacterium]|nr:DUF177 domain-containing protein [Acidobacteriota bacterium]
MSRNPFALDVSRIREKDTRVGRVFQPGQIAQITAAGPGGTDTEHYRVVAPVELAFDLHKDHRRFRLTGTVRTVLEVTCGRCLEPFTRDVNEAFDLVYLPQSENRGEGEVEIEGQELTTAFYQDDLIDLWQLMREQFYLSLPMKLLCSEACRGLCPECGTNLNVRTCECRHTWEDPRLAGLRSLLPAVKEKNHA